MTRAEVCWLCLTAGHWHARTPFIDYLAVCLGMQALASCVNVVVWSAPCLARGCCPAGVAAWLSGTPHPWAPSVASDCGARQACPLPMPSACFPRWLLPALQLLLLLSEPASGIALLMQMLFRCHWRADVCSESEMCQMEAIAPAVCLLTSTVSHGRKHTVSTAH